MIVELFTTTTPVAAVNPMLTLAPATKPEPLIVTEVPPVVVPVFGVMLPTTGAGNGTAP